MLCWYLFWLFSYFAQSKALQWVPSSLFIAEPYTILSIFTCLIIFLINSYSCLFSYDYLSLLLFSFTFSLNDNNNNNNNRQITEVFIQVKAFSIPKALLTIKVIFLITFFLLFLFLHDQDFTFLSIFILPRFFPS